MPAEKSIRPGLMNPWPKGRRSGLCPRLGLLIAALSAAGMVVRGRSAPCDEPGPVAARISADAPSLDSDLYRAMVECNFPVITLDFDDDRLKVNGREHAPPARPPGGPAYDIVPIDADRYAVVVATRGGGVRLFHVDVAKGRILFKAEHSCTLTGNAVSDELVMWHRRPTPEGDELVAEIADVRIKETMVVAEGGHKKVFHGDSCITQILLDSGSAKVIRDRAFGVPSKKECTDELLRNRLDEKTRMQPPAKGEVIRQLQDVLDHRWSMKLDWHESGCGFMLSDSALQKLRHAADTVRNATTPRQADLEHLSHLVKKLRPCSATLDLAVQLDIALADRANDRQALKRILRGGFELGDAAGDARKLQLRNLAAWRLLGLIARHGDKLEEYEEFGRVCDQSIRARDAAALRIDELRFHAACKQPSVAAFDEFVTRSPGALQRDEALAFAAQLEGEAIDRHLADGEDAENIARGLMVRWKQLVDNKGVPENRSTAHVATRLFTLLGQHPRINETVAAEKAQDAQDEHEARAAEERFREESLEIQRHQARVWEQQLILMRESASLTNQSLMSIGSELQSIDRRFKRLLDQ